MNHDEVIDLLSMIAAFDQRTIGESDVAAWHAVANAGGWTSETARAAVIRHHTDSTDRIKPGHITQLIRAERSKPAPVSEALALPAAPPATSEHRKRVMTEFAEKFTAPGTRQRPAGYQPRDLAGDAA